MKLKTNILLAFLICGPALGSTAINPQYAGRQICAGCHPDETANWTGSHHDLAMQPASGETVLGDFDNASVAHYGVTTTFFMAEGRFTVRTEGSDGELHDYTVKYTFGVEPLQQYLIEFPGGRLQPLGLAWDTRPREDGGQRWFHLYPDEHIPHDDELHWTGPAQNWNSMCAECHSTNLRKNYDPDSKTFTTTWSEIDVSCEACHGPGSGHVAWAGQQTDIKSQDPGMGLAVQLDELRDVSWSIKPETGNAVRSRPRSSAREIEMCARCHARRSPISREYVHNESLMDHYLPRLLDEGMYHADGQINDEVYVYGSFLQSRMYHAGVTCSDCHDPHSLKLRVPGNGVCLQCHDTDKYEAASHHFHKPGSGGGRGAGCHMPPKTYMVVDPRHDHSFRIPRPDLSVTLGTPNACTNCHEDQSAEWASEKVRDWYGKEPQSYQRYADALEAGRRGAPDAGLKLADLVRDTASPTIARATALAGLGRYLNPAMLDLVAQGLTADDPMLRVAALQALDTTPVFLRVELAFPALDDPVRAVRIEAARLLAPVRNDDLTLAQRAQLERGTTEYIESQMAMAERPEAQLNLGNLYAARGDTEQAIAAYRTAAKLNPAFVPAYVNHADLLRSRSEEAKAEQLLRAALEKNPASGDLYHALGLSLVRQKRSREAVDALEQAAGFSPDNARYIYVYAIALDTVGYKDRAIMVLQGAQQRFPSDTDILSALVAFHRDSGNTDAAQTYADKLRNLLP